MPARTSLPRALRLFLGSILLAGCTATPIQLPNSDQGIFEAKDLGPKSAPEGGLGLDTPKPPSPLPDLNGFDRLSDGAESGGDAREAGAGEAGIGEGGVGDAGRDGVSELGAGDAHPAPDKLTTSDKLYSH